MSQKEFLYMGNSTPELTSAFLKNLQEAVLHALERRGLLSASQIKKCLQEIQNHNTSR